MIRHLWGLLLFTVGVKVFASGPDWIGFWIAVVLVVRGLTCMAAIFHPRAGRR
jgi:hypothetical protein